MQYVEKRYIPSTKVELIEAIKRLEPDFPKSALNKMKKRQLYAIYFSKIGRKKGSYGVV